MEPDGDEFLVLDGIYCVAYSWYKGCRVGFDDQLVVRMTKINGVSVANVTFGFFEAIDERVGPQDWIIGVFACHCFLQWCQDSGDARSGHLECLV